MASILIGIIYISCSLVASRPHRYLRSTCVSFFNQDNRSVHSYSCDRTGCCPHRELSGKPRQRTCGLLAPRPTCCRFASHTTNTRQWRSALRRGHNGQRRRDVHHLQATRPENLPQRRARRCFHRATVLPGRPRSPGTEENRRGGKWLCLSIFVKKVYGTHRRPVHLLFHGGAVNRIACRPRLLAL